MKQSYYILIIAFVSTLLTVLINESNLSYLDGKYPSKNGMITTADEASYFQPVENYLSTGEWKDNSIGNSAYIQRPPGYGGIYMIAKSISRDHPFVVLKIIQLLLFFFGIILLASILKELQLNERWILFTVCLYGLLPLFSGFIYYTLTEGITPFLMLLLLYSYIKAGWDLRTMNMLLLSLSIILITIVRPQLLIFPILITLILVYRNRKYLLLSVAFLPLIFWQMRTYSLEGQWTLHPIYSSTNHSIYRPPHEAMTDLFRLWEYRSDRFHESIGILIRDTTETTCDQALGYVPKEFHEEVRPILRQFQLITMYQRKQFETGIDSSLLLKEKEFAEEVNSLTASLTSENLFMAYFKTPFMSGVELFSKSQMNLAVYQSAWRGNWLVETLRYICLLIILFSFGFTLWYALRNWNDKMGVIAIGVLFTVLYLLFVQRLNEERYLTPLIPMAFITAIHGIWKIKKGLTS